MKGAGGSEGGFSHFFIGLIMMAAGGYLLLSNITVSSVYHFGGFGYNTAFSSVGGFGTSGYVFLPMFFGITMIFFKGKSYLGWALVVLSLTFLVAGVITNTRLHFRRMNAFELISIFVLCFGGLGFFLRSLRSLPKE